MFWADGYPQSYPQGRREGMNKEEELAHLHTPSADPKQRMIDYWGLRAEKAEAEVERLRAEIEHLNEQTQSLVDENAELLAALKDATYALALVAQADGNESYLNAARAAIAKAGGKK
jgi:multidrug resistance efflux pump